MKIMSPRLKAYFIFGGLVGYIPNTYNTIHTEREIWGCIPLPSSASA